VKGLISCETFNALVILPFTKVWMVWSGQWYLMWHSSSSSPISIGIACQCHNHWLNTYYIWLVTICLMCGMIRLFFLAPSVSSNGTVVSLPYIPIKQMYPQNVSSRHSTSLKEPSREACILWVSLLQIAALDILWCLFPLLYHLEQWFWKWGAWRCFEGAGQSPSLGAFEWKSRVAIEKATNKLCYIAHFSLIYK